MNSGKSPFCMCTTFSLSSFCGCSCVCQHLSVTFYLLSSVVFTFRFKLIVYVFICILSYLACLSSFIVVVFASAYSIQMGVCCVAEAVPNYVWGGTNTCTLWCTVLYDINLKLDSTFSTVVSTIVHFQTVNNLLAITYYYCCWCCCCCYYYLLLTIIIKLTLLQCYI
jgi:hypothetical protein